MALFESYERRIDKINSVLSQYGISSVEECRDICKAAGFDPYEIVKGIQPICFENACWAYTVGAAIALKSGVTSAAEGRSRSTKVRWTAAIRWATDTGKRRAVMPVSL